MSQKQIAPLLYAFNPLLFWERTATEFKVLLITDWTSHTRILSSNLWFCDCHTKEKPWFFFPPSHLVTSHSAWRDFLVAQWLRIHLSRQGMWVQSQSEIKIPHALGQLSWWVTTTEPRSRNERDARTPQRKTTWPETKAQHSPPCLPHSPHKTKNFSLNFVPTWNVHSPKTWTGQLRRKWKSLVSDCATPWTIQSMEVSRPEYWNGQPFLLQGISPTQGSNSGLPHGRQILYQLSHREALN